MMAMILHAMFSPCNTYPTISEGKGVKGKKNNKD